MQTNSEKNAETWMIKHAPNQLLYIHVCSVDASGADGIQRYSINNFCMDEQRSNLCETDNVALC